MRLSIKPYITKETEAWIIEYNNCTDKLIKNKIYEDHIHRGFLKLIEVTINVYYKGLPELEWKELEAYVLAHLFEKLPEFDPNRGARAFSFFATVAKHRVLQTLGIRGRRVKKQVFYADYDLGEGKPYDPIAPNNDNSTSELLELMANKLREKLPTYSDKVQQVAKVYLEHLDNPQLFPHPNGRWLNLEIYDKVDLDRGVVNNCQKKIRRDLKEVVEKFKNNEL